MNFISAKEYRSDRAWGAITIANFDGVTTRLHWTDQAYHWHVNDGVEVFVVLDGIVNMHFMEDRREKIQRMEPGDIVSIEQGAQHVACPVGEVRVLVTERENSV